MDEESPLAKLHAVLQAARLRKRLSMTAVATRSYLSRTTVSQAFNADVPPSAETLVALAPLLGLDHQALLTMRKACFREVDPPWPPRRPPDEDVSFETRYRAYLKTRHGSLTVVGLDLRGPAASSWPLDTAYLSLELAEPDGQGHRVERAERAVRRDGPMLIKGLAGSGKTTLLQWIACAAADGKLPGPDERGQSLIAFVLPLRTLARLARLPGPEEFLSAVGCPLAGVQPAGWTDRVLSSGRGIVLVDGLDEVPETLRDRAREWLAELVAAYGHARFVVTTRPTAVAEGWLAGSGFRELTVRPMSRADVAVFVSRWHTAARKGSTDPEVRAHLTVLEEDLKEQVRAKRDLALLTTTPLLCALVCALHRDRRGQLPHDRVELDQAALSMLLYRRDHEREVVAPEGIRLSETESARLLQKLAYWLIRNGRTELYHYTAVNILTEALLSMHSVAQQGSPEQVLNHLLARSGLLRRPSADSIDFVHRTFQDFLGAKAAVEAHDLHLIARQAHDAQWEDVVRMAVAHARPDEAAVLLDAVITRAEREPEHRRRLVLLALACLRHAPELDSGIRAKVQQQAAVVLPPRNFTDAEALSRVGPLVLDLLPRPGELPWQRALASAQTAKLIGGDGALAYLKPFGRSTDEQVRALLCQGWDGFDPDEYVAQVLAPMAGRLPEVQVSEARQFPALRPLHARHVSVVGDHAPKEIAALPNAGLVSSLDISSNARFRELSWLAEAFPRLESLWLNDCGWLRNLDSLSGSTVKRLWLDALHTLHDVGALKEVPGLRALHLIQLDRLAPEQVPALPELEELEVDHTSFRKLLDRWPGLVRLSVPGTSFILRGIDAILPRLRELELRDADLGVLSLRRVTALTQVTTVELTTGHTELSALAWLFPAARTITVTATRSGLRADLAPLGELGHLESLTLRGFAAVTGTDGFAHGVVRQTQTPRP